MEKEHHKIVIIATQDVGESEWCDNDILDPLDDRYGNRVIGGYGFKVESIEEYEPPTPLSILKRILAETIHTAGRDALNDAIQKIENLPSSS